MTNMTDWFPRNPATTMFRSFFALIDSIVYTLMSYLYQIFFAIAGVDFLGGDIVRSIYSRVQLILGVFMIFKLAVSILQGIVSPDAVLDKKRGMGTIVTRIIVSLLMLSLVAPINIASPSNEWEKQVNDNGLLFGTLYSLQNRILANNTIGRLIVGANAADQVTSSKNLGTTGRLFANTVLKTFVGINVTESGSKVCPSIDSSVQSIINNNGTEPGELLSIINIGCEQAASGSSQSLFSSVVQELIGGEQYAFSYFFIVSTIAGIIIDVVLIGYSVDVAIRVFKLAILRLIAPIPIIGHMNISAKEGKGEDAFSSWTRSLTSTYLDLFIRLAVIYFVLFIINAILANGFNLTNYNASGPVNVFAGIFIIIGLMFFAKQAPNYIKMAIGIKPGGPGSIGMTAMTALAGNIMGGSDLKKAWQATQETVAERGFGDKNKGKGLYQQTVEAGIKKAEEKYAKGLQNTYYERALDIGSEGWHKTNNDAIYNIRDRNGNVIGGAGKLEADNDSKWWNRDTVASKVMKASDKVMGTKNLKDLREAQANLTTLGMNQSIYSRENSRVEGAIGRGNTVRNGYNARRTQATRTTPPSTPPSTPPTGPTS